MKRIIYMFITNFFRLPHLMFWIFRYSGRKNKFPKEEKYLFVHRELPRITGRGKVKMIVDGVDKLPADTSFIMYPNHQGLFDTLTMLQKIPVPFSPVVKKECEHTFLLSNVLRCLDAEFMDREDIRQSMKVIQSVAARVKNGENFVIYPEGTRSRQGNNMLEFKAGAFKAAMIAKCPIVPVALIDCFKPFDIPSIKKVTVEAHVLDPIPYEEYSGLKSHEISAMVQERIRQKITAVTGKEAAIVEPVVKNDRKSAEKSDVF